MPTYNVTQFYFGNFEDLDPVEAVDGGGGGNELDAVPGFAAGTVFDSSQLQLVDIVQNDTVVEGKTNRLEENDYADYNPSGNPTIAGDSFTYDLGDGPVTSTIDSTILGYVTITLGDGTVQYSYMLFHQLENGDMFSDDSNFFSNKKIQSIRIDWVEKTDKYGTSPGKTVTNAEIVCYAAGTMIRTAAGDVPIETLKAGDQIITVDAGPQPLRWIGSRALDRVDLAYKPKLRPIRIRAGALGPDAPARDVLVSPQHRVLIRGKLPQRMFGQSEVLVAAKNLLALDGVEIAEDVQQVIYCHLLLDHHHLVWANGMQAETLYLGKQSKNALTQDQLAEIAQIFPEFLDPGYDPLDDVIGYKPARIFANGRKSRRMAERIMGNARPQ